MNNSKITFTELRSIYDALQKDQDDILVEYLNNLRGETVLDKLKTLLIMWQNDVSPSLPFKAGDKVSNVQIQYIRNEISIIPEDIEIKDSQFEATIGIPDVFSFDSEALPIYTIIKRIKMFGISLDFKDMPLVKRKEIIDQFPANIYNIILDQILQEKNKTIRFAHPALEKFSINLLANDPYIFIKQLFSNYDDFYFRDIVYYLSPKLGSNLGDSTIQDIEYYIKKLSEEGDEPKGHNL